MGDTPLRRTTVPEVAAVTNATTNKPSHNIPIQPVMRVNGAKGTTETLSFSRIEGRTSLEIKPFIRDLEENCRHFKISRPTCLKDNWSDERRISINDGVPVAFLMPDTNEEVNVSRWKTSGGQIFIAQQRSNSRAFQKFNHGEPAIIIPTTEVDGKRQIWCKWDPLRTCDESIAMMNEPGRTIHRTRKDDKRYQDFVGYRDHSPTYSAGSPSPPITLSTTANVSGQNRNSVPIKTNKRPLSSLNTSSEHSTEDDYPSDRPLSKTKRRSAWSPPSVSPPLRSSVRPLPSPHRHRSPDMHIVFEPLASGPPSERVLLSSVSSSRRLFDLALARGAADMETTILRVTYNGKHMFVLRDDKESFESMLAALKVGPSASGDSNSTPSRMDAIVTKFQWASA